MRLFARAKLESRTFQMHLDKLTLELVRLGGALDQGIESFTRSHGLIDASEIRLSPLLDQICRTA